MARWRTGSGTTRRFVCLATAFVLSGCGLTAADLFIPLPDNSAPDKPGFRDGGRDSGGDKPPPLDDDDDGGGLDPDDWPDLDNDASIAVGTPGRRCPHGRFEGELRCRFDAWVLPLTASIALDIGTPEQDAIAVVTGTLLGRSANPDSPLFDVEIMGDYNCVSGELEATTEPLGSASFFWVSAARGAKLAADYDRSQDAMVGSIDAPGAPGCEGTWTATVPE